MSAPKGYVNDQSRTTARASTSAQPTTAEQNRTQTRVSIFGQQPQPSTIESALTKKKHHEKRDKKEKAEKTDITKLLTGDEKVFTIKAKEDFDSILTEAGDKYIMVEFFATWCGPCRLLSVKLEELAALYTGKVIMVKIDVDDFEDLAAEYNVTSMPAFMIMRNKQKVDQFVGSKVEQLENALEKFVGKPGENSSS